MILMLSDKHIAVLKQLVSTVLEQRIDNPNTDMFVTEIGDEGRLIFEKSDTASLEALKDIEAALDTQTA